MLGSVIEGIKKVVKGIGIIFMDILSEVDPEVFGVTDTEKNSKDVSTIQYLNKKNSSDENPSCEPDEKHFNEFYKTFYNLCPYSWYGWSFPYNYHLGWFVLFDDE